MTIQYQVPVAHLNVASPPPAIAGASVLYSEGGVLKWMNPSGTVFPLDGTSNVTPGSVIYAGPGGMMAGDNTNFAWDATNKRLGIGTNAPQYPIDTVGIIRTAAYFRSEPTPTTIRATYPTQTIFSTTSRLYDTAVQFDLHPAFTQLDYIATAQSGAAFVNISLAIQDAPRSAIYTPLFSGKNELYFGNATKFLELASFMGSPTGTGGTYVWEYSIGGGLWQVFTPAQDTAGLITFTQTALTLGWLSWNDPPAAPAWVTDTVNAQAAKYWIRCRATAVPSVAPNMYAISNSVANGIIMRQYVGLLEKVRWYETGRFQTAGYIFPGQELPGITIQGTNYFGNETGGLFTNASFRANNTKLESVGNVFVPDTTAIPASPVAGSYLYSDAGVLKWKNTSGTIFPLDGTSSIPAGAVIFAASGGMMAGDAPNFYWDDTNNRLGIGTNAPQTSIHIYGSSPSLSFDSPTTAIRDFRWYTAGSQRWSFRADAVTETGSDVGSNLRIVSFGDDGVTAVTRLMILRNTGIIGIGTVAPVTQLHVVATDTVTAGITNVFTLAHALSPTFTAADGFGLGIPIQLQSSTGTVRGAFDLITSWATAADLSRKSRTVLRVYDTAAREALRMEASGAAPMIGFYGHTAVAQQTAAANATDLATAITLVNGLKAQLIATGLLQ